MWELVGFDVGLAVLASVAKVVNKHGGSALEGMHLKMISMNQIYIMKNLSYLCCSVNRMGIR